MQQRGSTDHRLQRWQEAILLLIVLLTPLLVNFWVEQQFEASKVWLLRSLVWVLAVLWLAAWLAGHRQKSLPRSVRNLVVALLLVLALSTFVSADSSVALFGSLDRAGGLLTQLCYLLLFCFVATQISSHQSRQLLLVITLTAIPICLLGLAQAAGWQPLPVHTDARSLLTTTLGRANFTGAYLALLLPLTLAAAQSAMGRWRRMGFAALFALEFAVIGLTRARAAWIAAVVGVGVFFWLQHAPLWSRRGRWLSALGGLAMLAAALLLFLQRGIAAGGSVAARWTIWQASLRLLWPRLWLGYGADTLELHFPSVYPPQLVYYQGRGVVVDRAHNWLLDWSLNYGVVATLLFLALVAAILWLGWQRLATPHPVAGSLSDEKPLENRWLAACMAGICAQLAGNLFLFEVAATAVVFWLLLGIVTAASASATGQERALARPRWLRGAILVLAVLIAGWSVWQGSLRPLLADLHSWRGTQALNRGDPAAALAEYETAALHQPQQAAYHVAAALTAAQLNSFAQAERAMNAAIALRPTDPVPHTQLAAIHARQAAGSNARERLGLAYGSYERAIALAPTIALTHQQYADLALRAGDVDLALMRAQRAVDLDATDGLAFGIVGWSQLQSGNLAAAQHAFQQAVRWQPDSADFYLGLATVYSQQGNVAAARQSVERSLISDPAYAPALALRLQLQND